MDSTIVVAVIVALGGIATQLVIAAVNKKTTSEIINYRVGELEKKVMKHNTLVERMTVCEESIKHVCGEIKELKEVV